MPRADDGSVKSRIADSSTVLLQGIGKIEVTSSVRAAGNAARVFQSEGTCFIRYHQIEAISRIGVEESGTLTAGTVMSHTGIHLQPDHPNPTVAATRSGRKRNAVTCKADIIEVVHLRQFLNLLGYALRQNVTVFPFRCYAHKHMPA